MLSNLRYSLEGLLVTNDMRKLSILVCILVLALQLMGIFDHSLWTPDEPRVAEISREMAARGDFLIPHLSGRPFLEKPPVYFTVTGLLFTVFGTGNEGFGRLSSVFFALATIAVVFFSLRTLVGEQVAALSTIVLATSFKFFEISHKMVVDIGLVFFIAAAMFFFLLAYEQKLRRGYILFWISISMAFLTKGIIGLAIPAAGLGIFVLWRRDFSLIKRIWFIPGALLVLGVMLIWGWVLYDRGGMEFVDTFYVYNQFGRFLHGSSYSGGHVRPFYFYIPTVLADAAPWSILLIPAMITGWRTSTTSRFFTSWLAGGFILLSISSTKRGLYFLPMFPAMAALTGIWMSRFSVGKDAAWERIVLSIVLCIIWAASILIPVAYVKIGGSWITALILAICLVVACGIIWKSCRRHLPWAATLTWAALIMISVPFVFPQIDEIKSYRPFFIDAGHIVQGKRVIGYSLTETVEALSPFYGRFFVESIEQEDRTLFMQKLSAGEVEFALVLPSRLDEDLKGILETVGSRVLEINDDTRKQTQLWKLQTKQLMRRDT